MVENAEAIAANLRLSRPDAAEWEMMIVGSVAEIGAITLNPAIGVGAFAVDVRNGFYVWDKKQNDDATLADMGAAVMGFAPLGTSKVLATHIDLTVIQWITPWDTGY